MTKIMIAEDEPAVAEILSWNLQRAGYDVVLAQDGLEALRACEEADPDLVVLDLGLPAITGYRVLVLLKRYFPRKPVIVVTARAFEEAEEVAWSGADDFITKPCEPAELVRRVELVLRRRDGAYETTPDKGPGSRLAA